MTVTTVLRRADEVDLLLPEWAELWRGTVARSPFLSPAWLLPWWRQFGSERPVVAALHDGGRLVGLLPAYILEADGACKLLPWGVGLSDYHDVLLAPDAPAAAAERLLSAVLAAVPDVPVLDIPELPPDAALLGTAAPPGWQAEVRSGITCPVLDLSRAGPDLSGAVPADARRKLRMNRHRADRIGGWTVEIATAATLGDSLAALFRLHGARWATRGEAGVFGDDRVRAFLANAAPLVLKAGMLRLAILRVGDAVAAAALVLAASPDRLMFYLSGFDAGFAAVSPGNLLLGRLLERAVADGVREIHFLRGGESYKYAWGAVDRHNATLHLRRAPA